MRQHAQYADSGGSGYTVAQMQHMTSQRMEHKPNNFQGRADHINSENEKSYGGLKPEGQWKWERDGSSHMFNEGQGGDASRSYYQSQGQRSDQRLTSEKQSNDLRAQPREADMEVGYEDNVAAHTFEGLEKRFCDDILKLTKEQNDAEDAENARHRERVIAINAQYEEQLTALRARHNNLRDEFLRKESNARQQQYTNSTMVKFSDHPHGYPVADPQRPYSINSPHVDSYRDRPRFTNRDPGFDPRVQYPGGRGYGSGGSGSRYYG